jgi:hypothetical protein
MLRAAMPSASLKRACFAIIWLRPLNMESLRFFVFLPTSAKKLCLLGERGELRVHRVVVVVACMMRSHSSSRRRFLTIR